MRHLRLPLALLTLSTLLLTAVGCDSADNPVAPSGSVLTITANPTQISLTGSATLTITGFKPDGNPLNPGTLINLSTTLGVLGQPSAEVSGGRATTTLRGDGRSGTATVTATLPGGGETSATVDVLVGQTAETQPTLSITASPNVIGLNESAEVTAVARNADGSLYGAGGQVNLRTDLGWLVAGAGMACGSSGASAIVISTQATSEAKATLCGGDQPGSVTITGSVDSSLEATASVTIENQRPRLIINVNPDNIASTETSTITVIARDDNDVPLGAGFQVQLLASFGSLSPANPVTDGESVATSTYDPGGEFGDAEIQAFLGSSELVTAVIQVRGDVEEVTFITIPETIQDEDQEIRLVARALDARNEGVPSVIAQFSVDGVNGQFQLPGSDTSSGGSVQTNASGDATIDLRLLSADLDTGLQFTVSVTVARESAGAPATDSRTISVQ